MSFFTLQKPGQGYWTRLLTGLGLLAFIVTFANFVVNNLAGLQGDFAIYIQYGVGAAVAISMALVCWWVLNKPNVVDFLIATESEMKKVNWPSLKEIIGSTWVVICGTVILMAILWVVNLIFAELFIAIGVLDAQSFLGSLFSK